MAHTSNAVRPAMMRWLGFLMVLTTLSLTSQASLCYGQRADTSTAENNLTYTFAPVITDAKLTFHVTLNFTGLSGGTSELELPSSWAGETGLESQLANLSALSPSTVISDDTRAGSKTVHYPPNATVTIAYDLKKDWNGPFSHPKQFRAILTPSYFEFNTQNALAHPKIGPTEVVNVRFDWQQLPANWVLATSFGTDNRCQFFSGFWESVDNALFAGGDFRVYRIDVVGQTLVVAIRGSWSFTDSEAIGRVQKILAVEKDFWHDNDFPYYLVTIAPYDTTGGSSDGSSFTNAFWMFLSKNQNFSYDIQKQLAHEVFHAWNPYKMGPISSPEGSSKWFTEGFTTYYSDLMLARAELLQLPEYVRVLNLAISKYEFSPVKNLSNSDIVTRYYGSEAVNDLPYVRGPVIALWLDAQIRAESKAKFSLDDMMYQLVLDASENPKRPLTTQRVLQTADKYLKPQSRGILARLVLGGLSVPVPDFPFSPCVVKTIVAIPSFELGFDRAVLKEKNAIAGVNANSEAFKAGIRDGQQVVGVDIYFDDVNKPARLKVRSTEGIKTIEYYPRGKSVQAAQYHLNDEKWSSNMATCAIPTSPFRMDRSR